MVSPVWHPSCREGYMSQQRWVQFLNSFLLRQDFSNYNLSLVAYSIHIFPSLQVCRIESSEKLTIQHMCLGSEFYRKKTRDFLMQKRPVRGTSHLIKLTLNDKFSFLFWKRYVKRILFSKSLEAWKQTFYAFVRVFWRN